MDFQSLTLSTPKLLQELTDTNVTRSRKRLAARVEFKVCMSVRLNPTAKECAFVSFPVDASDAPSDSIQAEREREEWEREQQRAGARARNHRSVSRERWVETMVVADSKLIEYHGSDNVESYIFTIMNMVRHSV